MIHESVPLRPAAELSLEYVEVTRQRATHDAIVTPGSQTSAGARLSCGLTTSGAAYCWGDALGNGTPVASLVPVPVSGGLKFSSVSVGAGNSFGGSYACGVTTDGTAYCWGENFAGQLGNGSKDDSSVPVKVAGQP